VIGKVATKQPTKFRSFRHAIRFAAGIVMRFAENPAKARLDFSGLSIKVPDTEESYGKDSGIVAHRIKKGAHCLTSPFFMDYG